MVTCTRTTQRVSTDNLQLNRIERMFCEKVTKSQYIVNNFTYRAPLPMNNATVTYSIVNDM